MNSSNGPIVSRVQYILLGLILAVGLWLRVDGLDWGLPFRLHPDEWKYVSGGAGVHFGEWNPYYFRNPPGYSYLNAAWYPVWLRFGPEVEIPEWLGIDEASVAPSEDVRLAYYRRPFDLTYGARALSALLGTLTVLFTWLLARRFLTAEGALAAAALAAVSFVGVRESHFATNDAAATCAAMAAVWAGVAALHRDRRWGFLVAAGLGGVAVAIKYNMFPAIVAAMGCRALLYWRHRNVHGGLVNAGEEAESPQRTQQSSAYRYTYADETHREGDSPSKVILDLIALGFVAAVAFLLVCPWPILDPTTYWEEIGKLSEAASQHWPGQDTRWSGIQLIESVWLSEGALASLMALVGLAAFLRARAWALFLFPAFYAMLVMAHPLYFVRFALPLLPFAAICAARGLEQLTALLRGNLPRREWVLYRLVVFCLLQPLVMDLRANWLFKQEDTRVQTLRWLKEGPQNPYFIVGGQFTLPIPYRTEQSPWGFPLEQRFVEIDRLPSDDLTDLEGLPARVGIALVSSFDAFPGHHQDSYEERRSALRDFMSGSEPAAVFHPWRGEWTPAPSDVEDTYHPVRNIWRRERPGPSIEAFRRGG